MLPLLSILACHGPEQGIDRTELSGAVIIPPVVVTEDAGNDATNEFDGPDLGPVTYRQMVATGTASSFGVDDKGFPTGDGDGYLFTVSDDGTAFDITLAYPYALGDTTKAEATVYELDIYSADGKTFYTYTTTEGQQGLLVWPQTLNAGSYVVIVYGLASDGGDDAYTLALSGLDPNTTTVLVGAYESGDIQNLGPPVAGTSVAEFVPDEEDPFTWVGNFAMPPGLRTATSCVVGTEGCAEAKTTKDSGDTGDTGDSGDSGDTGDTGDSGDSGDSGDTADTADTGGADTGGADTADSGEERTSTNVVEGVDDVYVVAGTFANLNAVSVAPGLFYSSQLIALTTANETSHKDVVVALDTQVPQPVGWVVQEKEPNDAFDFSGKLVDPKLAQQLPPPSGKGLTDIVNATQNFGKKHGGNDVDVFAVTPKTDIEVVFTMSWAEKDVNLDMYLTDSAGNFLLAAYKISGDVNPEFMGTADLGSPLAAGQTYYVVVFSYKGPAGDHDYKIEIAAE